MDQERDQESRLPHVIDALLVPATQSQLGLLCRVWGVEWVVGRDGRGWRGTFACSGWPGQRRSRADVGTEGHYRSRHCVSGCRPHPRRLVRQVDEIRSWLQDHGPLPELRRCRRSLRRSPTCGTRAPPGLTQPAPRPMLRAEPLGVQARRGHR